MISITGPSKNNHRRKIGTVTDPVRDFSGVTVPIFRDRIESGLSPALRNKGGMTLMEILVVIVIIAVLAAALLPAVTTGLKKSYVRKAEATIAALQNALEMYKRDWGYYPVSTGSSTQSNGNQGGLASSLTGTTLAGTPAPKKGQPYITLKKNDLDSSGKVLLDPWGNAYIYIARKYVTNWINMTFADVDYTAPDPKYGPFWPYTDPESERSRNTYNIYSLGPDGKTNGGLTGNATGNYATTYYDNAADGHNVKGYDADTNNDDDINSWSGQ